MKKYSLFIGCDVSKKTIDISYRYNNKIIYLGVFSNNTEGYNDFFSQLKSCCKTPKNKWFICFENTGVYSKSFLQWLINKNIACKEENALRLSKSLGLKRGKDDRIDSKDICQYAFEKRDSIKASELTKPLIVKLKKLLSRRDLLVRQKNALHVSLREQKQTLDPGLFEMLNTQNDQLLKVYKNQINAIEIAIKNLVDSEDEVKTNNELLQSIIGIGPVTAAYLIATTENFTCFQDGRKYASYSGIAPFPNSSGMKKGKNSVSNYANKKIKSILSNGVNTAKRYDKQIAQYYNKKIEEGKAKGVVINAIKNKLIHRAFAVIRRQTPYVKLMN